MADSVSINASLHRYSKHPYAYSLSDFGRVRPSPCPNNRRPLRLPPCLLLPV
ncbi:hypothetical protein NMA510612_1505 [Neisseria meningitidis]|uniref:Uncharacterized protein n=1 Tax=Neisseria meningitidis TaxID=487 RepID=X5EJJ5_NEIME|nr:hypothetical protein NMA510612_1505 [Neisseria meningitidis]